MSTERARSLRRRQSDAERKLWQALRARRTDGLKFKRQVPIGRYIADFMCFECKLIVELDGNQHAEKATYDGERTRWLEAQGFRVVRYGNYDALSNLDATVRDIWEIADARRPAQRA
jgi:very-short-patch-repair endonuclease